MYGGEKILQYNNTKSYIVLKNKKAPLHYPIEKNTKTFNIQYLRGKTTRPISHRKTVKDSTCESLPKWRLFLLS
jgi:hypothetical protein